MNQKQWNSLVKLIAFFPLHLKSSTWTPEEIKQFLVETANLVLITHKDEEK